MKIVTALAISLLPAATAAADWLVNVIHWMGLPV